MFSLNFLPSKRRPLSKVEIWLRYIRLSITRPDRPLTCLTAGPDTPGGSFQCSSHWSEPQYIIYHHHRERKSNLQTLMWRRSVQIAEELVSPRSPSSWRCAGHSGARSRGSLSSWRTQTRSSVCCSRGRRCGRRNFASILDPRFSHWRSLCPCIFLHVGRRSAGQEVMN